MSVTFLLAKFVGRLAFTVLTTQKKIIRMNLEIAFGESKSSSEIDQIIRHNFIHMAQIFFEILKLSGEDSEKFKSLIQYSDGSLETLRSLSQRAKGIIVITAHYGNWEVLARSIAEQGVKEHIVYRPLNNPYITGWINRSRERYPSMLIPREKVLTDSARLLKNNEAIILAIDQNQAEGGIFVPFFSKLAATARGPAVLARRFKAPVLAAYARRCGNNKHIIHFKEINIIHSPSLKDFVKLNVESFNSFVEEIIREEPSQWLWAHPRWKTRPQAEEKSLLNKEIPEIYQGQKQI